MSYSKYEGGDGGNVGCGALLFFGLFVMIVIWIIKGIWHWLEWETLIHSV